MPYYRPSWNPSSVRCLTDDEFVAYFPKLEDAIDYEKIRNERENHNNNGKIAEIKQVEEATREDEEAENKEGG